MGQDSAHTNHRNGTVDTPDTGQDTNSGQVVPAGLYRELQAEMVRKAEAAAMWQARAEFLAGELSQAREQLALMAPAGAVCGDDSGGRGRVSCFHAAVVAVLVG
jgi:hypothetical protein